MFTIRRKKRVSVLSLQSIDSGAKIEKSNLIELSESMPHREIIDGTIEWIVSRAMKTLFGIGQKELENLVNITASLVTASLSQDERRVFTSILAKDGSIGWDGSQKIAMERVFNSKNTVPFLDSLMTTLK